MGENERALAVRVTGRVQGVGFRAWTQREAMRLGLAGWVANHEAGHVDAVFFGAGDHLAQMVILCRTGPSAARVDHVDARSTDRAAVSDAPDGAIAF